MRKVPGVAFSAVCLLALSATIAVASTQTTSSNMIAVSPDAWTSTYTRASFELPATSPARPVATRFDDDTLEWDGVADPDIAIAPGRFVMPTSKLIAMTADSIPPVMMTTPTRPMALEGPLQIPEPASLLLLASGLMGLAFSRRRPA